MTIHDILEQARTLTPQQRQELINELVAMQNDVPVEAPKPKTGAEIVAHLEKIGPIDLVYPEIEDPVEWVKKIRQDQAKRRGLDWGNDE